MRWFAIALWVLFSTSACSTQSSAPVVIPTVEYVLRGTGSNQVGVTLENGKGGTEQRDFAFGTLWIYEIDNPEPGSFLYISAQNETGQSKTISCEIVVWSGDIGVVISEATSQGEYTIVSCDARLSSETIERGRRVNRSAYATPTVRPTKMPTARPTRIPATPTILNEVTAEPSPLASSVPLPNISSNDPPSSKGVVFVFESALLRDAPHISAKILAELSNETNVDIFGVTENGYWVLIRVPSLDNQVGWVERDLVFTTADIGNAPAYRDNGAVMEDANAP